MTASFYTTPQVLEMIPLSATTIWRMSRRGEFPRPVRLSHNRNGFSRGDVDRWIANRPPAGGSA